MSDALLEKTQRLLASKGLYTGAIDGVWGIATSTAIERLNWPKYTLASTSGKLGFSGRRLWAAAAQVILTEQGYEPGKIDGYWGHNSQNAYMAWATKQVTGKPLVIDRTPAPSYQPKITAFPRQRDCATFYGTPGAEVADQLVWINTYPMVIDWNTKQSISRIKVHKKCADSAEAVFAEVSKQYGADEIRKLGLHRFAGSYNHRRMRGGTAWSMHAYGCAIDFYAQPNGLTARCPQALFCRPEYKTFFDIWEAHGWTSLGRAIGRDWMHVQAASL